LTAACIGRRGIAFMAGLAILALPAAHAQAKKVLKTVTKSFCADVALPVPDGPARGDFVGDLVSTGKRCPKQLVCGYGGLPLGSKVRDVDARLRVTHPSVGDLTVLLVDPTGGLTTLTAANGGNGADFGSGATDCGDGFTSFDDSAATPIQSVAPSQAPFAGSFRPQVPLSLHAGSFAAGDWRFYFDDQGAGGQGVVEAIGIRLKYRYIVRRRQPST
jgi:hypothetical protein